MSTSWAPARGSSGACGGVKPKGSRKPIDAAISLAMANEVLASRPPPKRSVYSDPSFASACRGGAAHRGRGPTAQHYLEMCELLSPAGGAGAGASEDAKGDANLDPRARPLPDPCRRDRLDQAVLVLAPLSLRL
jgi:hypothetical protein